MVVMLSWQSCKIKPTHLLKSTLKLAKETIKMANIQLEDIGLIVHGGVYREHFRTEPAFATHIQGDLSLHCTQLSMNSAHCFSFDVTDGSCSPHIALQSIADLLPSMRSKYALLCVGDDRPTKHCEWNEESYCFVAVIGMSGNGPRLVSVDFDDRQLNPNLTIRGYFDEQLRGNKVVESGATTFAETKHKGHSFSGHQRWLSGQHMHAFHSVMDEHNDTLEHCIVDRSGKSTTAKWEF